MAQCIWPSGKQIQATKINRRNTYIGVFLWNKETIIWAPRFPNKYQSIWREGEIMGLNSLHIKRVLNGRLGDGILADL